MAERSDIDWLKRGDVQGGTWNPWLGCAHATYTGPDGKRHQHPGCLNCYAETLMDKRYHKCRWGTCGSRVVTSADYWKNPAKWNAKAQAAGVQMPVFPSLCDPFEERDGPILRHDGCSTWICDTCGKFIDGALPHVQLYGPHCPCQFNRTRQLIMADVRSRWFSEQIDPHPWLNWIIFTKRPQNIRRMWPEGTSDIGVVHVPYRRNVSLYYSASNQATLDYGAPLIVQCRDLAPVIGISAEPLLGRMDFTAALPCGDCGDVDDDWKQSGCRGDGPCEDERWWGRLLTHVIIGCESNGPRVGRLGEFTSEADWCDGAADIVEQCQSAGVPCYVKQVPVNGRVSHDPSEWPDSLRVREFPGVDVACL